MGGRRRDVRTRLRALARRGRARARPRPDRYDRRRHATCNSDFPVGEAEGRRKVGPKSPEICTNSRQIFPQNAAQPTLFCLR